MKYVIICLAGCLWVFTTVELGNLSVSILKKTGALVLASDIVKTYVGIFIFSGLGLVLFVAFLMDKFKINL